VYKLCNDEKKAKKELGKDVANKLMLVINIIEDSICLRDILMMPQYKLHSLEGDLKWLYSIYLGKTSGYRLLITPLDENEKRIVCNDMSIYTKAVCVEIEEVSKHYE
jgi:proteic killer suppression protein